MMLPHTPELDVSLPIIVLKLTKQITKLYEIIKEMHTNIGIQVEDMADSIPELRKAYYDLIEDHCINIRSVADALGDGNALVREL